MISATSERHSRRAVRRDPASAVLNEMLGTALRRSGDPQAALRFSRRAVELDAQRAGAWNSLGIARMQLGNRAGAATCFRRVLELQPERAEALWQPRHPARGCGRIRSERNLSAAGAATRPGARFRLGDPQPRALWDGPARRGRGGGARRAASSPARPTLEFHESQLPAGAADWAAGWDAFEKRLQLGEVRSPVRLQRWDGSARAGARIFVYGEQGLGDQIMFASCIPDLVRPARPSRWRRTAASSRSWRVVCRRARAGLGAAARDPDALRQQHDCEVALGSLPFHFRRAAGDFPARPRYLRADPARVCRLAQAPGCAGTRTESRRLVARRHTAHPPVSALHRGSRTGGSAADARNRAGERAVWRSRR